LCRLWSRWRSRGHFAGGTAGGVPHRQIPFLVRRRKAVRTRTGLRRDLLPADRTRANRHDPRPRKRSSSAASTLTGCPREIAPPGSHRSVRARIRAYGSSEP
jgi:hypothetical protein